MIRVLLFLLSLISSVQAFAFAIPVTPPPPTPIVYTDAPTAPAPLGSGSASTGQLLAKIPGGQVAGVICMTINCKSSFAVLPTGIVTPSGWSSNPSSGTATPPASSDHWPPDSLNGMCTTALATSSMSWAYASGQYSGLTSQLRSDGGVLCFATITTNGYQWSSFYTYVDVNACPSGYKNSSGSCALDTSGASGQVQKPASTPCQAIMSNGQPRWDTTNPSCASRGAGQFWTDDDGNKESIDTGNGTFSVISSDGKNTTTVGPLAGNTMPIKMLDLIPDLTGAPHKFEVTIPVDTTSGKTGTPSYTVDGIPVTKDNYDKLLNGTPSTELPGSGSSSGTGTGSGSGSVDITCETVGTCGVAQDSTLKDVAAKAGAIQTGLSDFFKNFTTAVAVPQLYTPSTTTAQSVLSDFSGQIKATPIVTSVTGFFDVSFQGGACPTWTMPVVSMMGVSIGGMEIDQFCTPTAYRVYSIIAVVTLVVCGFFGFRVAVDG